MILPTTLVDQPRTQPPHQGSPDSQCAAHTDHARPVSPAASIRQRVAFLREFVKAPHIVAAVTPSSPRLARMMLEGIDLRSARVIVEYGPGTGTFTKAVLQALPPGWLIDQGGSGRFYAIEFNEALAQILHERFPRITVAHDDAANVLSIVGADGVQPGGVDCVVSGLGWPSFSDEQRTRILEATAAALRTGGEFRTFGYHVGLLMRGAWHFRSEVKRLFREVHMSRVVWRNTPPAFVYRCIK